MELEKEETGSVAALGSGTTPTEEVAKRKRIKCIAFAVAFTLFQTGILLLFIFFVLRFKNPKFRVNSAIIETFEINPSNNVTGPPPFNFTMNTEFSVKNTNFGHFKYGMSNVTFEYRGIIVGTVSVDKARSRARSTRKFYAKVGLKFYAPNSLPTEFNSDVRSGKLPITSSSELNGKIEFMKLIKKKKSAQMNCNMNVDIKTRTLQDIFCI